MNSVTFRGKVITGEGNGKKYLALPWVKHQIEEKLGYTPFLGTLNLELNKESIAHKKLLEKIRAITICPAQGYCLGTLYQATVENAACAIVAPKVKGYKDDLLEIIAPVNLRAALKLKDGDAVTISVNV
jgi:riboflavin kinase, archaea type